MGKKKINIVDSNKAVAYVRVSSREQEKGYSLNAQEKLLTHYAKQ